MFLIYPFKKVPNLTQNKQKSFLFSDTLQTFAILEKKKKLIEQTLSANASMTRLIWQESLNNTGLGCANRQVSQVFLLTEISGVQFRQNKS